MDYDKKKAEKAFALLKELYPIMNDYTKEKIAGIIPESKESDDERIRKGLLETFKNAQFGEWGKLKIKDIIAWLEKQKEQKPTEWSEEDEHCIELLDTIIDSSALIPKNRVKCHAFLKSIRMEKRKKS